MSYIRCFEDRFIEQFETSNTIEYKSNVLVLYIIRSRVLSTAFAGDSNGVHLTDVWIEIKMNLKYIYIAIWAAVSIDILYNITYMYKNYFRNDTW